MTRTMMQSTHVTKNNSDDVSTLRAFLVVSFISIGSLVGALYLVLGMMSLLMYLFPWAP
jgi:pheromone shutdown protein TraB